MSEPDVRGTAAWRRLVRWAKANLPWSCHLCGGRIPRNVHRFHDLAYELDHKLTVRDHPELALHVDNVAPSHRRCNAYRKARPLTRGLIIEITERFTVRTPSALGFFGDTPGGAIESPGPDGTPTTVIPSSISPRLHTVTTMPIEQCPGQPVTLPDDGGLQ